MHSTFSPEEIRTVTAALERGVPLACPRCAALLDRRAVPTRRDVSYVRDRVWVACPACHAGGVLDRREGR